MDTFAFALSGEEKNFLLELARASIAAKLAQDQAWTAPQPPTQRLREPLGAFVTLHARGRLRGCIGRIVGSAPLYETIAGMARAAAFEDPRFPPVSPDEREGLRLEISILSPITRCPGPEHVVVGRHGLIMRRGMRQGLLLPQVPVEWRWSREEFLAQTCRKAGLSPDDWKLPDTEILWFEAVVFSEPDAASA